MVHEHEPLRISRDNGIPTWRCSCVVVIAPRQWQRRCSFALLAQWGDRSTAQAPGRGSTILTHMNYCSERNTSMWIALIVCVQMLFLRTAGMWVCREVGGDSRVLLLSWGMSWNLMTFQGAMWQPLCMLNSRLSRRVDPNYLPWMHSVPPNSVAHN